MMAMPHAKSPPKKGANATPARNLLAKRGAREYHLALHAVPTVLHNHRRNTVNPRFLNLDRKGPGAIAALAASLAVLAVACSSPRENSLDEFARWHDSAKAQAQAGALMWSEFYKQSFDRLTALPPSIQQDTRLENTVLLLSTARKYEASEITALQFNAERESIETQLQARLR